MAMNDSYEDKILTAQITDGIARAQERYVNKFIGFLDERQAALALDMLRRQSYTHYSLYGGYEDASRVYLGIFSPYEEPESAIFPIYPVTFTYRAADRLAHRDFLGALMALMITRDSIGDILVGEGHTVAFLSEKAATLAIDELKKVGSVGVKAEQGICTELPQQNSFETIEGVVASERLDSIAALLTKLSREKAVKFITSGLVSINFQATDNISYKLSAGDKISIRGYGRFIFDGVSGTTKKGRTHVTARKFT